MFRDLEQVRREIAMAAKAAQEAEDHAARLQPAPERPTTEISPEEVPERG